MQSKFEPQNSTNFPCKPNLSLNATLMQLFFAYLLSLLFVFEKAAFEKQPQPRTLATTAAKAFEKPTLRITPQSCHPEKLKSRNLACSSAVCDTSFVRRFGDFGVNEESYFFLSDGNGNYFIAGRNGTNSLILQVDPSGNILVQRTYDFTNGDDFVATLMVDDQGFLVGSARDQLNSDTRNVQFKINWQTGNVVWAKRLDDPTYNRFDGVFQHPQSGNYFHYGATTASIDDYIIEMDKGTGNVTWQFVSDYGGNADVYTRHFLTNNAVYYAGEGRLGGNLDDIRPTLTKFDLNGNMQWARIHLRSPSQPSRLYNMDLFIENETSAHGRGSLTSDDLTTSQLLFYKTNINGGLIWAKSYAVTGGNTVAGYKAHPIPGGYIVQGTYDDGISGSRFFLARLNKSGNVVWAKKIKTITSASGVTKPLTVVDNGFVVFAAQTMEFDNGQNNDILFGKIALDGQVTNADCPLFEDITLVASNISNPYDGSQVPTVFSANYNFPTSSHSPLAVDLAVSDIPGCNCELTTQDSCDLQITLLTQTPCPLLFNGSITAVPSGGVPPYIYTWQNDTVFTNQLTHLDVGTYLVTVTDVTGCAVVDSVTLVAATRPEVESEVQDASCFGVNDGTLTIVADDPSLLFSVEGALPNSQVFYKNIWPGGYQYIVTDTFGCTWPEVYFIDAPNKITLQLPNILQIQSCDSVQIELASPKPSWSFDWQPATSLSCTDCPNPFALPLTNTTYLLTVTDTSGCKAMDSIKVRVEFEAMAALPNAFSPNGDGLNDVFYVIGKCAQEVQVLRVFDRWGELVFEKSNTPPNDPLYGWDGSFRGEGAMSDVYIYFAKVRLPDSSEVELRGDLTLLR